MLLSDGRGAAQSGRSNSVTRAAGMGSWAWVRPGVSEPPRRDGRGIPQVPGVGFLTTRWGRAHIEVQPTPFLHSECEKPALREIGGASAICPSEAW